MPQVIRQIDPLRAAVGRQRAAGRRIGLVPTMGALHEGHLSLIRAARAECDVVIATVFVNPTQFAPGEDFDQYPRTLEEDLAALDGEGVAIAFVPPADEVYRPNHGTWVVPEGVAEPLEGEHRPGHFRGVATVVLKLLNMAQPDVAYFGQKDFQQAAVIRRMVEQLDVPVAIRVCPIVREPDGLAMSSRNRYLDADARRRALGLAAALRAAETLVAGGETDASSVAARMREVILDTEPRHVPVAIDYVALRDPETLERVERIDRPVVALIAARVAETRLIDNAIVQPQG